MKTIMKKITQALFLAAFSLAVVSAAPVVARAASSGIWDSGDCPSAVAIANHTTQENASSNCWGTSVSAKAGDEIDVRIIYHNHSSAGAAGTVAHVNQPAGTQNAFSFTGFITSGSNQLTGSSVVNFTDGAHSLTLVGVTWYPANPGTAQSMAAVYDQQLGTIAPNGVGNVKYRFVVNGVSGSGTGTGTTGTACTINSFTANPASIVAGSSATLSWNTTGCANVSLAGGRVSGNVSAAGSRDTGAVNSTTTYVLTAAGGGKSVTASAIVNVRQGGTNPTLCQINSFAANPGSVSAGGSSMLSWSTTGCANVTISGGTLGGNQPVSGSLPTGALFAPTTYTLTAWSSSGQSVSQFATVNVNTVTQQCSIGTFYASPSQVASGSSTTLYWNTTGCTSVSVTGPGVSSSALSGSVPTGVIYGTATFTITAYGPNGPVSQNTTVTTMSINPQGSAPVATTMPSSMGPDGSSQTLNGYIGSYYSSSYASSTTYSFQYGTSQYSLYNSTPTQTLYNGSGNVSAYVTGLMPNTTYYYQLVASNSYGSTHGGVLSFVTNAGGSFGTLTAMTTLATNVVPTSARLNGLVYGTQSVSGATTYFEYGTSPSFGSQTSAQSVINSSVNNYFDVIYTSPNTTYYYRIVAVQNGQKYYGSSIAFTTPGVTTGGPNIPTTNVVTQVIGVGAGSAFVSLNIADQSVGIAPGDAITYTINWQNVSTVTLTNATLSVVLPSGVTYTQSTQGVLTTNNTVVVPVGTLVPGQAGSVTIFARANETLIPGTNLVTTATLAFTTPRNAQDSAIAYVLNNVVNRTNSLAGLALWGGGFFPGTLLGWVILIGLIIILVLLARWFYDRQAAERAARMPVQHNYYGAAAANGYHAPAQPSHSPDPHAPHYGGYQGDNLPH